MLISYSQSYPDYLVLWAYKGDPVYVGQKMIEPTEMLKHYYSTKRVLIKFRIFSRYRALKVLKLILIIQLVVTENSPKFNAVGFRKCKIRIDALVLG